MNDNSNVDQLVKALNDPRDERKEVEENQPDGADNREVNPEATKGEAENEKETEEFVIDEIVNHRTKKSRNHQYDAYGEPLYCVRLYGLKPVDDTWEPKAHLTRSKILSYVKSKKLAVPDNIDEAVDW